MRCALFYENRLDITWEKCNFLTLNRAILTVKKYAPFQKKNKKKNTWHSHLEISDLNKSRYSPKVQLSRYLFLSHLLVAGCNIGVRFSVRPSVRQSVRQSVRLSTFMSTFDIYVKVSILINYKTKQPSNLAWNISLTSWLCNLGVRFSVCLSIRPSVCQHLCRSSTFMSKLVF